MLQRSKRRKYVPIFTTYTIHDPHMMHIETNMFPPTPSVEPSQAQRFILQFYNPMNLSVSYSLYSETDFDVSNSRISLYPFKTIYEVSKKLVFYTFF